MTEEKDELPQLKELYDTLRADAQDVVKELGHAHLIYRVVSMVMLVYGGVSLALGIAGIVLTYLVTHLGFLDMSLPGMLVSIVIGIVLVVLGGKLDDKSEKLKKYGSFTELKI